MTWKQYLEKLGPQLPGISVQQVREFDEFYAYANPSTPIGLRPTRNPTTDLATEKAQQHMQPLTWFDQAPAKIQEAISQSAHTWFELLSNEQQTRVLVAAFSTADPSPAAESDIDPEEHRNKELYGSPADYDHHKPTAPVAAPARKRGRPAVQKNAPAAQPAPKKRVLSEAGRRAISEAAKRRHAAIRK